MPKADHFAALEQPELLAQEIQAFFGSLPRLRCESGLVTIGYDRSPCFGGD